ncbi:pyruvate dehydrogenase E1 component [Deinococcus aerolatus]|uniref:Pyruvate dehydrogenase E1 component n=1 Tax=Deinococcus aerolatus TaxID=522487 RepID=A0ABQ2G8N5_9DEIO|nr:pyruvate dehydrogenase (acetyl-transferring), homodimeric type [Deinococcus aerolatus]GGL80146.1 pyruvate dehydrogenase E1 component [Deinococcus aerolatus]
MTLTPPAWKPGQDPDPTETAEWIDSLEAVIQRDGPERAAYLLDHLLQRASQRKLDLRWRFNTPMRNTIAPGEQPAYPGDPVLEAKLGAAVRWNAVAMVMRANQASSELGGHLATFASAADLYEVAFNHFLRAGPQGDVVFYQPHAAPGMYARAFLEGRLSEDQLLHYRREVGGQGLSSYPHPWLMPDFWSYPTGSMGLGPVQAIYQARFMKYLERRGLLAPSDRKVWCFVGDGEMDEPEARGALSVASREGLDNLIWVVNCNLQRLDGPVRGNGSIVQELEAAFGAAGWDTIKVLWGSEWDDLFARDDRGLILERMNATLDGEYQNYKARDGAYGREHFFGGSPELRGLVSHLSDAEIQDLRRGGHDPLKIHAAYARAVQAKRPTVVLALSVKGYGLGSAGEGKNTAHQQKKLDAGQLRAFRDRFKLPLSDDQLQTLAFYRPPEDAPEMRYLRGRREALGGPLPARQVRAERLEPPAREDLIGAVRGSEDRPVSTTMAFNQLLLTLLRHPVLGPRVVPIIPDEARTFGMNALFRQFGIYAPEGQRYRPEDADQLLYYREAEEGQVLQEGINEDGAFASWMAAATAYSTHGLMTLPFYTFYSMFGFQRVGDLAWAAADARARGFLMGATAGRTTLSGEGLQHQDGHSLLLASSVPTCRAYDPAFAYELAVIVHHGLREMLTEDRDHYYYITLMNETYLHPAMPPGAEEGIVRGMYRLRALQDTSGPHVRLLGSGTILREVLRAAELLADDWGVGAEVWSVTSFGELRRDGMEAERLSRLHPEEAARPSFVGTHLNQSTAPVIAATDYLRAVPDMIRPYLRADYVTLGTDGFGRSDTRAALRAFFEVDAHHIVLTALKALSDQGTLEAQTVTRAMERYGLDRPKANPLTS